jgi:hypothetical protein
MREAESRSRASRDTIPGQTVPVGTRPAEQFKRGVRFPGVRNTIRLEETGLPRIQLNGSAFYNFDFTGIPLPFPIETLNASNGAH